MNSKDVNFFHVCFKKLEILYITLNSLRITIISNYIYNHMVIYLIMFYVCLALQTIKSLKTGT